MAPTTSEPTMTGSVQPRSLPFTSAQTMASKPPLMRARPGMSRRSDGPWLSSRRKNASGITSSPIGTFTQKIHCQARPSAMAPPTSGPMAIASPATPPHAPSATARRSGRTLADRMVRLSGVISAPPTPWMARARMSSLDVEERAAYADPAVNRTMPMMNMRLRPNRSPSAAPVSSSTAKVSV